MSIEQGIRNVLRESGAQVVSSLVDHGNASDVFVVERARDGTAAVRYASAAIAGFTTDALRRCVDLFSDAGFLVALVRDDRGVYVSVS